MDDLFLVLKEDIVKQYPVVLLTVVESTGSTPREVGAHALVRWDGTAIGTIGGGAVEARAFEMAREAFSTKTSNMIHATLQGNAGDTLSAVCGGNTEIFCQYFSPEIYGVVEWISTVVKAQREHLPYTLLLNISSYEDWGMAIVNGERKIVCTCGEFEACHELNMFVKNEYCHMEQKTRSLWSTSRCDLYSEVLARPGRVFIFGAGHVAKALVPVLAGVGFSCVVIDDRPEYANAERFPQAEEIFVGNMNQIDQFLVITEHDYVCIMTRGHVSDYEIEKQVLPSKPGYLGIIGSQAKIDYVNDKLIGDGFSQEELNRVYAPIGLPISAATPAEIAVSIAGELIAVRARRDGHEKISARKWRAADVPSFRISR